MMPRKVVNLSRLRPRLRGARAAVLGVAVVVRTAGAVSQFSSGGPASVPSGLDRNLAAAASTSEGTPDCSIKGNISFTTGERIYHLPGQRYYDETDISTGKGERYFCSEAEARAAGWRRSTV